MKDLRYLIIITIVFLLRATGIKAQEPQMYAGISAHSFISEGYTNIGPEISIGCQFDESFKAEVSGMYIFEKDFVTRWSTALSMMYVRHTGSDKFSWYPIAGLRLHGAKSDTPFDSGEKGKYYIQHVKMVRLGVDLGIGCEYYLSSHISLFTDFRYFIIIDGASNTGALRAGLNIYF